MDPDDETADDIQAQVLQTTLAEISSSRKNVASDSGEASSSNLPDCCVICLDAISEPCAALPCAHANFDFLCLLSWLQERAACPLCKAAVYKVRYRDAKTGESVYRVPNAPRTRDNAAESNVDQIRRGDSRRRRRRSPEAEGSAADHLLTRPAEAIERRRHVYRHQLHSLRTFSSRQLDL